MSWPIISYSWLLWVLVESLYLTLFLRLSIGMINCDVGVASWRESPHTTGCGIRFQIHVLPSVSFRWRVRRRGICIIVWTMPGAAPSEVKNWHTWRILPFKIVSASTDMPTVQCSKHNQNIQFSQRFPSPQSKIRNRLTGLIFSWSGLASQRRDFPALPAVLPFAPQKN